MATHHSNYYQSWSQHGVVRSWNASPSAAPSRAQWSMLNGLGSSARNDWRLFGSRIDWIAKSVDAQVSNTARWTVLGYVQQTFRNDWQLLGRISSSIAVAGEEIGEGAKEYYPRKKLETEEEELIMLIYLAINAGYL